MAQDIDYMYKFALRLIRKNQAGSLTGLEFADFWNAQQRAYQRDLLGRWQSRNSTKEGANTGLIQNETILTQLAPFTINITLTVSAGLAAKPANFISTLALRIDGYPVFFVNKGQIWSLTDDVIDPPSAAQNCYYYTEYGSNYKIFPDTVTEVELDYIKAVTDVVWGYNATTGRFVYDAAASVQPEWDSNSCSEITQRILKQIGVSYKDNDFAQFGQSIITTGD